MGALRGGGRPCLSAAVEEGGARRVEGGGPATHAGLFCTARRVQSLSADGRGRGRGRGGGGRWTVDGRRVGWGNAGRAGTAASAGRRRSRYRWVLRCRHARWGQRSRCSAECRVQSAECSRQCAVCSVGRRLRVATLQRATRRCRHTVPKVYLRGQMTATSNCSRSLSLSAVSGHQCKCGVRRAACGVRTTCTTAAATSATSAISVSAAVISRLCLFVVTCQRHPSVVTCQPAVPTSTCTSTRIPQIPCLPHTVTYLLCTQRA